MSLDDFTSDVVYISSLSLSANIGNDWWGRARPQPLSLSLALHMLPAALDSAAVDDDVTASVHYGHLCKDVLALTEAPGAAWGSAAELARDVAHVALRKAAGRAKEVRVQVHSAKLVPLAEEYVLEMSVASPESEEAVASTMAQHKIKVIVKKLVIPVVIGVNPPEREAKQRVITDVVILAKSTQPHFADYPDVIAKVLQKMETTAYLTLEKFALDIVREICLSSDTVEMVSVRAAKPSALAFADAAGVQICRPRRTYVH
ncbi:hypothetical protein CERSUDRAFT_116517 [Gelatoporia subvermispora B]|uniref:dihydroneopterin aldolase n=1 Tax=Ceriporiopsis subvermispora (strain B) TaxID=914234 RepID=M2R9A4_CERS8|nr:hypothetical protein CERSUDRAFT_116517 [Gelatoporia subvermispora B]